jgi:hypothetical protein
LLVNNHVSTINPLAHFFQRYLFEPRMARIRKNVTCHRITRITRNHGSTLHRAKGTVLSQPGVKRAARSPREMPPIFLRPVGPGYRLMRHSQPVCRPFRPPKHHRPFTWACARDARFSPG